MALIIRAQLFEPGLEIVPTNEQYNQLFTMHGTIMLLMFATPLFAGFANVHHAAADRRARRRVPAPERVRVLALPASARLIAVAGFLTPQGAAVVRLVRLPAARERRRSRRASAATCGCSASA